MKTTLWLSGATKRCVDSTSSGCWMHQHRAQTCPSHPSKFCANTEKYSLFKILFLTLHITSHCGMMAHTVLCSSIKLMKSEVWPSIILWRTLLKSQADFFYVVYIKSHLVGKWNNGDWEMSGKHAAVAREGEHKVQSSVILYTVLHSPALSRHYYWVTAGAKRVIGRTGSQTTTKAVWLTLVVYSQ